jgi:MarR family
MSVQDTTGVSAVAKILSRLADGAPRTVVELARTEGLSRSSAFELVRRLEAAEFVVREPGGKVVAGPTAIALAFGRFGVARLHGPAQALLVWLRDHCDATAALSCADADERIVLASFSASWTRLAAKERSATMSYPICESDGREVARLDLACRHNGSRIERTEIEKLALRVKASLEQCLAGDDAP